MAREARRIRQGSRIGLNQFHTVAVFGDHSTLPPGPWTQTLPPVFLHSSSPLVAPALLPVLFSFFLGIKLKSAGEISPLRR